MKCLTRCLLFCLVTFSVAVSAANPEKAKNPHVRITTNLGVIELELDAAHAPNTVRNFMNYVQTGFYSGTIFHRVIPGFMIQGGGFRPGMDEKVKGTPIRNEADNGLKNLAGTIAMARTSDPHSASAQFFINTVDNQMLDFRGPGPQEIGYTVFGRVIKGLDVVNKIRNVPTARKGPHGDVPVQSVLIERVTLIETVAKPAAK